MTLNEYSQTRLQKFDTPPPIMDAIEKVIRAAMHSFGPNLRSVVLIGSAARGQLNARTCKHGFFPYSDLDFLIVTNKSPNPAATNSFKATVGNLESTIRTNSIFDISATVNTWRTIRLKRLIERRVANFDLYNAGLVVHGHDFIRELGPLSPRRIDHGNTEELLLVRLWMQLLLWPPDSSQFPNEVEYIRRQVTARNILEWATIVLSRDGIMESDYDLKVQRMVAAPQSSQIPRTCSICSDCAEMKRGNPATPSLEKLMEALLEGAFYLAQTSTKHDGDIKFDEMFSSSMEIPQILDVDWPDGILPKYRRIKANRSYRRNSSHAKAITGDPRPMVLHALLCMQMSKFAEIKGHDSSTWMKQVRSDMSQLSGSDASVELTWDELRRSIVKFMATWFYRSKNPAEWLNRADQQVTGCGCAVPIPEKVPQ